jgi:hypothetical protein
LTELEPTNEIKRVVETRKAVNKKEICDDYTIDLTIDELYLCLMRLDNNTYEKQARDLIYRIPIYKPIPFFDIKIPDLNTQVKKELEARWDNRKIPIVS